MLTIPFIARTIFWLAKCYRVWMRSIRYTPFSTYFSLFSSGNNSPYYVCPVSYGNDETDHCVMHALSKFMWCLGLHKLHKAALSPQAGQSRTLCVW